MFEWTKCAVKLQYRINLRVIYVRMPTNMEYSTKKINPIVQYFLSININYFTASLSQNDTFFGLIKITRNCYLQHGAFNCVFSFNIASIFIV
jgi:hypothetical protein